MRFSVSTLLCLQVCLELSLSLSLSLTDCKLSHSLLATHCHSLSLSESHSLSPLPCPWSFSCFRGLLLLLLSYAAREALPEFSEAELNEWCTLTQPVLLTGKESFAGIFRG
jgi:hypothetical protein